MTTTVPAPAWGWPRDTDAVEVQRVTERGAVYAMDRVYLNGDPIGFVIGRVEGRGRRWWGHHAGRVNPTPTDWVRTTYPTTDRRHAICALIEATRRSTR